LGNNKGKFFVSGRKKYGQVMEKIEDPLAARCSYFFSIGEFK